MESDKVYQMIKQLAEIPGPVGRENAIQKLIQQIWNQNGLQTSLDKIGNLYGRLEGEGPHWAIVGHADSIGFIVQQILISGFLKMAFNTAATTPDARFLAGKQLEFLVDRKNRVYGYFGLRSGHLAGIEGKKTPILFDHLFVDIGVDSDSAVYDLGIDIGTSAVFATPVRRIQQNIVGKAMDNRVALVIQILLMQKIRRADIKPNITFISTVQEELGMKGAAAAAKFSEFDYVLNIDVGLTGDTPLSKEDYLSTKLGAGPIIVYKDFSIHYSSSLINMAESIAINSGISVQKAVFKNYNTDGMLFFMQGFPTLTIAVPCRYTHTDFETVRISDIENTISLIYKILESKSVS